MRLRRINRGHRDLHASGHRSGHVPGDWLLGASGNRRWVFLSSVLLIGIFLLSCDSGAFIWGEDKPAPVPGAPRISLEEYLVLCAENVSDEVVQNATYGELSVAMAESTEKMLSFVPPPEVADWHSSLVSYGIGIQRIADGEPRDEIANPLLFVTLVPRALDIESATEALDPEVRMQLVAAGCLSEAAASLPELDSPENVRVAVEGSTIRVSWDGVDRAGYYNVYHGDQPNCRVFPDGGTLNCELLASDVVATTYAHTDPHPDQNYYWVAACDGSGCSGISTGDSADEGPDAPGDPHYSRDRATATVSWGPSEKATHYKVYYNQFENPDCFLSNSGRPLGCRELDGNVVGTTYIHGEPDPDLNYYWVVACTTGGCSEIDSTNPARPVATRPGMPSDVRASVEGSSIRVSWNAVDGADHYAVFHDDFFDSSCSLGSDGSSSFCDELATGLVETTYVHTDPGTGSNYYWVIACNRGGCSEIKSENPARPNSN